MIPVEERVTGNKASKLCFPTYRKTNKCIVHGMLGNGTKPFPQCIAALNANGAKIRKITIRKELADVRVDIGSFHKEYYKPMLLKYRYNYTLVKMLSRNYCCDSRTYAFKAAHHDVTTTRYSAKCLLAKFHKEIQSTNFGMSITLSMEGCFVQFLVKNGDVYPVFHSHMVDKSNHDAASTHAHMKVLLQLLTDQGRILRGISTIWEHSDGCTK